MENNEDLQRNDRVGSNKAMQWEIVRHGKTNTRKMKLLNDRMVETKPISPSTNAVIHAMNRVSLTTLSPPTNSRYRSEMQTKEWENNCTGSSRSETPSSGYGGDVCSPRYFEEYKNSVLNVKKISSDEHSFVARKEESLKNAVSSNSSSSRKRNYLLCNRNRSFCNILDYKTTKPWFMVEETPELYNAAHVPFIKELNDDNIRWIFNIQGNISKEAERIFYRNTDPRQGFCLIPNERWTDTESVDNLHVLAIPNNDVFRESGLKSLRDLNAEHLPMLRRMFEEGPKEIEKKYGVTKSQLRIFISYPPSYYYLHVHYCHLNYVECGINLGKAHLLSEIIQNLERYGDWYVKATIPFCLKQDTKLYRAYKSSGFVFPNLDRNFTKVGADTWVSSDSSIEELMHAEFKKDVIKDFKSFDNRMRSETVCNDKDSSARLLNVSESSSDKLREESDDIKEQTYTKLKATSYAHNTEYVNTERRRVETKRIQATPGRKGNWQNKKYIVYETPNLYQEITLPTIQSIMKKKSRLFESSADSFTMDIQNYVGIRRTIIYEDKDPETGFSLHPEFMWDSKTVTELHCISNPKQKIMSLRDLTKKHLPLLKKLLDEGSSIIEKRYKVPRELQRIVIYYSASVQLEVHYCFYQQYHNLGLYIGKAHLLQNIINNIERDPDYYKNAVIPFCVTQYGLFYNSFKDKGYSFAPCESEAFKYSSFNTQWRYFPSEFEEEKIKNIENRDNIAKDADNKMDPKDRTIVSIKTGNCASVLFQREQDLAEKRNTLQERGEAKTSTFLEEEQHLSDKRMELITEGALSKEKNKLLINEQDVSAKRIEVAKCEQTVRTTFLSKEQELCEQRQVLLDIQKPVACHTHTNY